ncbi:MAG TPA: efflux RND transporter periplasmic adaptor subunit [Nitrospira sp.]|jgi:HlyD family secretion protein|nr:efflux RND transporter periplasmic adaptor subunit [Nitrospira sp.]HNP80271.1 efflux RND transporter periplasmic adaptor subunit [Nitrospira sp.]HNV25885.1 efflux RND transporter periplasmic adaptor subunit [Nitrospira sp.]HPV83011.1 efflux RND transporter periplasmic adaptor subunit [Nitrospira sp.]HRB16618.1 efflux RND transporter periplasmic adaptor subunit [Nitrospira sp.]
MGGDRITIPPRTGDSGPIGHGASPPVAAAPGAGRTIPTAWMRALLILSLLVLAVAAGLYFQSRPVPDSGVLRVSGNIEITDAEVSFKIAGRVVERSASEGESVKAGQSVARLDTSELAQEVALRSAEVRAAEASLAELVTGSRPEEIAQSEAVVRRMQADVARARADFKRLKKLYEQDNVSGQDYDAAKSAVEVTTAKLGEAQEQLRLVQKGPRIEKVERARAQLQQAKEALALAETRLGYATLTSPLTGVVLSHNIEPGEFVAPGTPIVTVGDLAHVWLRAYIDETDLGRVKVGQVVKVTADTYPDKVYEGRVSFIASQAEFTPKSVQTKKERVKLVYRTKITVDNPHMELKAGMPADARIVLDGAEASGGSH